MLYISSDHAGFKLKNLLTDKLQNNLKVDFDDFPDFAAALAKKVVKNQNNRGILICGSGHGMCIAANKIKGARAILGASIESTELGRRDNDANILCMSGHVLSLEHALAIVKRFLETDFDNKERRLRRLKKISNLE